MNQERLDFNVSKLKNNINNDERTQAFKVLKWAIDTYYPRIAIASSFSIEDTVVIDLATKIEPAIQVFYINTGLQFKETEALKEVIKRRYHLNLVEYSPRLNIEDQNRQYWLGLCGKDPDLCCKLRKVEPIERALGELDAWITGLRREQANTRRNIKTVEFEFTNDGRLLIKINPLARWRKKQVWQYIVTNQLPYNALYDQGYTSIGCEPCTQPIQPGDDERAGRWAGKDKTECGIHTFTKTQTTR